MPNYIRPLNICGPKIRKVRSQKKITQDALAAKCQLKGLNFTRNTIILIEQRKRWVGDMELAVFAKILKVSASELIGV